MSAGVAEQMMGKTDRRSGDRFSISRDVRYRVLSKRGTDEAKDGQTINMSSSGMLFTTTASHMVLPGQRLEVSVSWPTQLNSQCALKLVTRGRVMRFENGRIAVEVEKHEFRTRSTTATGPAIVR